MTKHWNPGDAAVLRWIAKGRIRNAQPMVVLKDKPEEAALLMVPDTTCKLPQG
jgi:hypothetical protein